jgi:hypothetical protein
LINGVLDDLLGERSSDIWDVCDLIELVQFVLLACLACLLNGPAAVYGDDSSGHKGGLVTGQVERERNYFLGTAQSTGEVTLFEVLPDLGLVD